jgi:hypothetical protein
MPLHVENYAHFGTLKKMNEAYLTFLFHYSSNPSLEECIRLNDVILGDGVIET